MKCKCAKCYKELEEKDQVKSDHSIYCQECHWRDRMIGYVASGIIFVVVLGFFFFALFLTNKDEE